MSHPAISETITFIYTTHLSESIDFYEKAMGFKLSLDQGGCRIYRIMENSFLGVCQRPAEAIQQPAADKRSVIITIVSPDVDGWYKRLSAAGVKFETKPKRSPEYGIYHSFLRDPNGYLIEIQCFDNPDWDGSV